VARFYNESTVSIIREAKGAGILTAMENTRIYPLVPKYTMGLWEATGVDIHLYVLKVNQDLSYTINNN
jgi:hypothetical protein